MQEVMPVIVQVKGLPRLSAPIGPSEFPSTCRQCCLVGMECRSSGGPAQALVSEPGLRSAEPSIAHSECESHGTSRLMSDSRPLRGTVSHSCWGESLQKHIPVGKAEFEHGVVVAQFWELVSEIVLGRTRLHSCAAACP